jgi:hypothetical protein
MENRTSNYRKRNLFVVFVVAILMFVIISKTGLALATMMSTDSEITILQTTVDESTNLAQMTISYISDNFCY